jgi:hypothetical protein
VRENVHTEVCAVCHMGGAERLPKELFSTSSFYCAVSACVFILLPACCAMSRRHDTTTAVCVSMLQQCVCASGKGRKKEWKRKITRHTRGEKINAENNTITQAAAAASVCHIR